MEDKSGLYNQIDKLVAKLEAPHFELDEKTNNVVLTDDGNDVVEGLLKETGLMEADSTIYDVSNITLVHHVTNALKAHKLFARDKDYIVKDGQVVLIDEFTGRMMEGRRFSDGLHQALEAKEGAAIQPENQTLASVTFQNYFRHVRQNGRHDRDSPDRGRGIDGHLRAGCPRNPDQHPGGAP